MTKNGGASLVAQMVNAGDQGLVPASGRSPEERNANPLQYSCLEIPWLEEPGRLQFMGLQRVQHNWATSLLSFKNGKVFKIFSRFVLCPCHANLKQHVLYITGYMMTYPGFLRKVKKKKKRKYIETPVELKCLSNLYSWLLSIAWHNFIS